MNRLKENRKLAIAGICVLVAVIVGLGVWFGFMSQKKETTPDGVIEVPSFSVTQQVADTVGVAKEDLKDQEKRIRVKSTVVDERAYSEGNTIDDLMDTAETAGAALLTQVETTAAIYDYGDENYYAAKLNTTEESKWTQGKAKDVAFARDNYNGEVVDGVIYDYDSGVAYIPKSVVDDYVPVNETAEQGNVLQAQLLYVAENDKMSDVFVRDASVTNNATGESVDTYAGSEVWNNETYIQLVSEENADKVDVSSINVQVNDGAISQYNGSKVETGYDTVSYNKETGWLKVANTAAGMGNMSVSFDATDVNVASNDIVSLTSTCQQIGFIKDGNGNEYTFNGLKIKGISDVCSQADGNWKNWCFYVNGNYFINGDFDYGDGHSVYMVNQLNGTFIDAYAWVEGVTDKSDNLEDLDYFNNNIQHQAYRISFENSGSLSIPGDDVIAAEIPSDAQHKTTEFRNAGNDWSWTQNMNQTAYKAYCTHISNPVYGDYSAPTETQFGEYSKFLYTKVIVYDDDYITLGFVATGPGSQTCSMIGKFRVQPQKGGISIDKQSSDEGTPFDANRNWYTRENAQYGVWAEDNEACSGNPIATTCETDVNGHCETAEDALDGNKWYWVKEIKPPNNGLYYKQDTKAYKVYVNAGTNQNWVHTGWDPDNGVNISDEPKRAGIRIYKVDGNPSISNDNACYGNGNMEGAVYGVFTDAECKNAAKSAKPGLSDVDVTATVVKENGKYVATTAEDDLWFDPDTANNAQRYFIKEITTPTIGSYSKDPQVYTCVLTHEGYNDLDEVAGRTENKNVSIDLPLNDPVNILLQKVDADTGKAVPTGNGELKGAQFTVRYYDTTDATSLNKDYSQRVKDATRTWVFQTGKDGVIEPLFEGQVYDDDPNFRYLVSGELYRNSKGEATFPIGTYVLEETSAPKGYNLPDCQERTFIEVVKPGNTEDGEAINTYHHETYKPISTETGKNTDGSSYTYTGLGWSEWKIDGEK